MISRINLWYLLIFICVREKKPGLYLQWAGNKLLNMFFHKCSYKISIFDEFSYNSSVLCANFLNCYSQNNKNWLKQSQSHFHKAIRQKSYHFLVFWCILCTKTPDISSSSENTNNTSELCFKAIFLLSMTMMPGI